MVLHGSVLIMQDGCESSGPGSETGFCSWNNGLVRAQIPGAGHGTNDDTVLLYYLCMVLMLNGNSEHVAHV